jgi:hypothetical protein
MAIHIAVQADEAQKKASGQGTIVVCTSSKRLSKEIQTDPPLLQFQRRVDLDDDDFDI